MQLSLIPQKIELVVTVSPPLFSLVSVLLVFFSDVESQVFLNSFLSSLSTCAGGHFAFAYLLKEMLLIPRSDLFLLFIGFLEGVGLIKESMSTPFIPVFPHCPLVYRNTGRHFFLPCSHQNNKTGVPCRHLFSHPVGKTQVFPPPIIGVEYFLSSVLFVGFFFFFVLFCCFCFCFF